MPFFKNNSKGQVTVEYLLLAVTLLVLTKLAFNQIKSGGYLDELVTGPNAYIASMLKNGVWSKDKRTSNEDHPNQLKRHWSLDP